MITGVSDYVDEKIDVAARPDRERQARARRRSTRRIGERDRAADASPREQDSCRSPSVCSLLTNLNSTIGFAEQRRGTVQSDLLQARQLLSLAERRRAEPHRRARGRRARRRRERAQRRARRRPDRPAARRARRARRRPVPGAQEPGRATPGLRWSTGKRVAVVVPAFEEEQLVAETLRGIPELVDRIYVVDDASTDATAERAREVGDPRVEVIVHERNGGVGAAIVTGLPAGARGGDRRHVRDGRRQPDGSGRARCTLVEPVARGEVDYAKANRLVSGEAWS